VLGVGMLELRMKAVRRITIAWHYPDVQSESSTSSHPPIARPSSLRHSSPLSVTSKETRLENSQRSRRNLHTGSYSSHNTDPNPSHLFERHIHKSLLKLRLDMNSHGRTQHNGTGMCHFHLLSYYLLFFLCKWAFVRFSSYFHMNGASWAMEFHINMNS